MLKNVLPLSRTSQVILQQFTAAPDCYEENLYYMVTWVKKEICKRSAPQSTVPASAMGNRARTKLKSIVQKSKRQDSIKVAKLKWYNKEHGHLNLPRADNVILFLMCVRIHIFGIIFCLGSLPRRFTCISTNHHVFLQASQGCTFALAFYF
jgi:hypothetical protein